MRVGGNSGRCARMGCCRQFFVVLLPELRRCDQVLRAAVAIAMRAAVAIARSRPGPRASKPALDSPTLLSHATIDDIEKAITSPPPIPSNASRRHSP